MPASAQLLEDLERYYDEVPRATAVVEEVGPFTLFLRAEGRGWPFYARPRLGCAGPFTAEDVRRVRERQRAAGEPEAFEWVAETTPDLEGPARDAGLEVGRYPLMVLDDDGATFVASPQVRLLDAEDPALPAANAAIGAAFGGTDEVEEPTPVDDLRDRIRTGTFRIVGAFDDSGAAVGGGSHSPRGAVTELTGIGVLPRCRRRGIGAAVTAALVEDARAAGVSTVFLSAGDDRTAAIYSRVGFRTVATACIAGPRS